MRSECILDQASGKHDHSCCLARGIPPLLTQLSLYFVSPSVFISIHSNNNSHIMVLLLSGKLDRTVVCGWMHDVVGAHGRLIRTRSRSLATLPPLSVSLLGTHHLSTQSGIGIFSLGVGHLSCWKLGCSALLRCCSGQCGVSLNLYWRLRSVSSLSEVWCLVVGAHCCSGVSLKVANGAWFVWSA